jgi:hypothetical protein
VLGVLGVALEGMSRSDRSEEFWAEFLVKLVEQGFNSILRGVGG